jgi:hypothetical protein
MAPLFELKTMELSVIILETAEEARKLEAELIQLFRPIANTAGLPENRISKRKLGPRLYGNHNRIRVRSKT